MRSNWLRVVRAGMRLELAHLARGRLFLALTLLAGLNFLIGMSLFGLTGSYAPTAFVDLDHGPAATALAAALSHTHHSFTVHRMAPADAEAGLRDGRLVAAIIVPHGFSARLAHGQAVTITVEIDNVDVDRTDDVQRALPTSILYTGRDLGLPGGRIAVTEHDLLGHDTNYVPYLTVSALALDALVIAAILGATSVAREWEGGAARAWKLWRVSPASPVALLVGKVLAASLAAGLSLALAAGLVVFGYGVSPRDPLAAVAVLATCVVIFACVGACLGALIRRTQPLVPLIFGLAMPLYVQSGALEPARFDGERLWVLAHLSPIYYAIGGLESAFHGLQVTPEPVALDMLVLAGFAALALTGAGILLNRAGGR